MSERRQDSNEFWGIVIGGAVALSSARPRALQRLRSGAPCASGGDLPFGAALLGAGVTVLMWGPISSQFERAGQAIVRSDGILFDPYVIPN